MRRPSRVDGGMAGGRDRARNRLYWLISFYETRRIPYSTKPRSEDREWSSSNWTRLGAIQYTAYFCLTQFGRSAAEAAAAEFWRTISFFSRDYFLVLPGKSEAEYLGGLRFLMLSFTKIFFPFL